MKCKVNKKQIEFKVVIIRYFCDDCQFEKWDERVIPKMKCDCNYYADHEEWEG